MPLFHYCHYYAIIDIIIIDIITTLRWHITLILFHWADIAIDYAADIIITLTLSLFAIIDLFITPFYIIAIIDILYFDWLLFHSISFITDYCHWYYWWLPFHYFIDAIRLIDYIDIDCHYWYAITYWWLAIDYAITLLMTLLFYWYWHSLMPLIIIDAIIAIISLRHYYILILYIATLLILIITYCFSLISWHYWLLHYYTPSLLIRHFLAIVFIFRLAISYATPLLPFRHYAIDYWLILFSLIFHFFYWLLIIDTLFRLFSLICHYWFHYWLFIITLLFHCFTPLRHHAPLILIAPLERRLAPLLTLSLAPLFHWYDYCRLALIDAAFDGII